MVLEGSFIFEKFPECDFREHRSDYLTFICIDGSLLFVSNSLNTMWPRKKRSSGKI